MPQLAFVDEKVVEELEKRNYNKEEKEDLFPEHAFLGTCLKIGLSLTDLERLTYVDVLKIFLSLSESKTNLSENGTRKANQRDIDRLLG